MRSPVEGTNHIIDIMGIRRYAVLGGRNEAAVNVSLLMNKYF